MMRYVGRGLLFGTSVGLGGVTAFAAFALLFGSARLPLPDDLLYPVLLGGFAGCVAMGLLLGLVVGLRCARGGPS